MQHRAIRPGLLLKGADWQWRWSTMPSTSSFLLLVGVPGVRSMLQCALLPPSPAAGSEARAELPVDTLRLFWWQRQRPLPIVPLTKCVCVCVCVVLLSKQVLDYVLSFYISLSNYSLYHLKPRYSL